MPDRPLTRITVLISGGGTNLQALIDAHLPNIRIIRVISNRRAAYGLQRASAARIPTAYHNLVPYKQRHASTADGIQQAREEYDRDLAALVLHDEPRPDLVVCAGWMHILAPAFLDAISAAHVPVINLHPALPGQFDGADAIRRAYEAGLRGDVDKTGVMVHYVVREVDRGEAICVREVPLRQGEDLDRLEARIHLIEWELIVEATVLAIDRLWNERKNTQQSQGS